MERPTLIEYLIDVGYSMKSGY